MQTIWRNINKAGHSGYFIWDIHEVAEPERIDMSMSFMNANYLPTLDGGLIRPFILHTFRDLDVERAATGDDMEGFGDLIKVVVVS